ncbi:hypothetical protein [Thermithiobacillus plumbiphilus]|uniref:DUF2292 domain-containing protein n=1 Tax=Thermithiobacillus plumbiphilus TaxID=1729899 RepID=A0ABU9D3T2_9PROT
MTREELSKAKDPELVASIQAIKRAAAMARKIAVQTDTGIVIMKDDKLVRVSAEQLRIEHKA